MWKCFKCCGMKDKPGCHAVLLRVLERVIFFISIESHLNYFELKVQSNSREIKFSTQLGYYVCIDFS